MNYEKAKIKCAMFMANGNNLCPIIPIEENYTICHVPVTKIIFKVYGYKEDSIFDTFEDAVEARKKC